MRRLVAAALLLWGCGDGAPPPGSPARVQAILEEGLTSPSAEVRAATLNLLGLSGAADRLPAVEAAASDPDALVRLAALGARARLAPAPAADDAARRFAGADRSERRHLLGLAAQLRTGPVAEAIRDAATRDPEPGDRRALARLAAGLEPAAARRLLQPLLAEADTETRLEAARMLFAAGFADALPWLFAELTDVAAERRAAAASLLGEVGERTAVPALLRAAEDPEGIVAAMAAISLCRLGHDPACGRIVKMARSRDASLLRPALAALVALGDGAARAALAEAVTDPDAGVRAAVAQALLTSDDAATRALAEPLLRDAEPGPRAAAATALVRDGHEAARDAIREAFGRGDPFLRRQLVEALAATYRRRPGPGLAEALRAAWDPAVVGEPQAATRSEDVALRALALQALLEAGAPEARRDAAAAALADAVPELRYLAARAITAGDAPDPGAPLDEATTDPVPSVRLAAAAACLRHPRRSPGG